MSECKGNGKERQELDKLDQQMVELRSKIREAEECLEELKCEAKKLKEKICEAIAINSSCRKDIEDLKACNAQLRKQKNELKAKICNIANLVDCLKERISFCDEPSDDEEEVADKVVEKEEIQKEDPDC